MYLAFFRFPSGAFGIHIVMAAIVGTLATWVPRERLRALQVTSLEQKYKSVTRLVVYLLPCCFLFSSSQNSNSSNSAKK